MTTPISTPTGFAALGVPPEVDKGLAAAGFAAPFAIQTEAIPVALRGVDVCGRARTGSGKTLAFGVPIVVSGIEVFESVRTSRISSCPYPRTRVAGGRSSPADW